MEIDLSVTLPFTVFRIRLETAEGSISLVRSAVERPMSDEREQTSNAIHNLGDVTSKSGLRRLETFEAVSLYYIQQRLQIHVSCGALQSIRLLKQLLIIILNHA